MASGSPSRLRQRRATAARLASVSRKPGTTAAARSAKRASAGWRSASDRSPSGSGTGSGRSSRRCSPVRPRRCRLVARIRAFGVPCNRAAVSSAQAVSRCSQLSITRSRRRSPTRSASASSGGRPTRSGGPSAAAAASGTRAGSSSPARSTKRMPSGNVRWTRSARRRASRVLPTPPGPVSVTSRDPANSWRPPSSSARRPTKPAGSAEGRSSRRGADPPMTSQSSPVGMWSEERAGVSGSSCPRTLTVPRPARTRTRISHPRVQLRPHPCHLTRARVHCAALAPRSGSRHRGPFRS